MSLARTPRRPMPPSLFGSGETPTPSSRTVTRSRPFCPRGLHHDRAAGLERTDAVPDRVLDQRLQDEMRHERSARFIGGVDPNAKPILKTHALDLEVLRRESQLFVQRHLPLRLG